METKTIKQTATFRASAHAVYEALMDSASHAEFTGEDAEISREVGGSFTTYGDYIEGTNLELVPDSRIVQSWRASDWPPGHYSQVTFLLEEEGGVTTLSFEQTGVPAEFKDSIAQGWRDYYWGPLKATLED